METLHYNEEENIPELYRRLTDADVMEKLNFMSERFGQAQKHISSTGKAEKVLGFKASVTFEEGLKKTIQWYKNNRTLWEKQMMMRKVSVKAKDVSII